MTDDIIRKIIVIPFLLIVSLYICYTLVSELVETTLGFGDVGWYVFGAIVTAVVAFIGYAWLKR